MPWVIAAIIYCGLIFLFFYYVFYWATLIVGGCISIWAVVNFVRAVITCCQGKLKSAIHDKPDDPSIKGREPAYRQYFFRRAILDLRDIVEENAKYNTEAFEWLFEWAKKIVLIDGDSETLLFTWPLVVVFLTVGLIGLAAAIALNVAFVIAYALFILLMIIVNMLTMAVVRLIEQLVLTTRQFAHHCPNRDCYARFSLPVYECSTCNARHASLVPGVYGILKRRCACGQARLPTTYLMGRQHLDSFCPRCNHRLEGEDPLFRPMLLPVIAGRSAGKTVFQVSLLMQLLKRQDRNKCTLAFVVPDDQYEYETAAQMFNQGHILPQTLDRLPKALQMNYTANGRKLRIHMYDAAGEAYEVEEGLQQLTYLEHCHGIFLLIDPFSIEAVHQRFDNELKTRPGDATPCDASPEDVYSRLIEFLQQQEVRSGTRKVRIPLALVITKRDAFGLDQEIGAAALREAQKREYQQARKEQREARTIDPSEIVRQWLCDHNLEGLILNIEGQFSQCRYFACSALGRMPSRQAGHAFSPRDVEAPFDWLIEANHAGLTWSAVTSGR